MEIFDNPVVESFIRSKFELKVKLDEGAYLPTKAHEDDAGFDLRCRDTFVLKDSSYAVVDTGVHMMIPKGYVGMIKSKSGLNVKDGIITEGVVDAGYTGSIIVKLRKFTNDGDVCHLFVKGDKIAQIVILPIPEISISEVDYLGETDRGDKGFGSSGN